MIAREIERQREADRQTGRQAEGEREREGEKRLRRCTQNKQTLTATRNDGSFSRAILEHCNTDALVAY